MRVEFRRLVRETRPKLAAVYASNLVRRREAASESARCLAEMRDAYDAAKAGEASLGGFDRWFAGYEGRGVNNASLAAVGLYDDKVPAFRALLSEANGDLPVFYARARRLQRSLARSATRSSRRLPRRRRRPRGSASPRPPLGKGATLPGAATERHSRYNHRLFHPCHTRAADGVADGRPRYACAMTARRR